MHSIHQTGRGLLIATLLCLLTLATFWPVSHSEFIRFDDGQYVVRNPHVNTGLTWENVRWAFQGGYANNWHPLTWLSHMLDVQWFGLKPGAHHLTNLLWHTANAILVFLVLRRLTAATWRSALVAALFALHPFHVESVAWISERKDVLSTFFFLLTLGAYARYAERSRGRVERTSSHENASENPASTSGGSVPPLQAVGGTVCFYCLALVFFSLGLMSKPMLVTLPFVMLLLDYWPLARFQLEWPKPLARFILPGPAEPGLLPPVPLKRLLLEKAPFFGLAFAVCVVTLRVQTQPNTNPLVLPFTSRLANATVAYLQYVLGTFWPVDLAIFYPHPDLRYPLSHQWPIWGIGAAALVLAALSLLALRGLKRTPWLAVGWFWFLGTLVPVIGLVQVGLQARADRYTYIPHIGFFICLVWGVTEACTRWRVGMRSRAAAASLALLLCATLTRQQVGYWQDNLTLFQHALAVTQDNAVAHFHVGTGFGEQGQFQVAADHFRAAIQADPTYEPPYFSLGLILAAQGHPKEAIANFRQSLRLNPNSTSALYQLAWLLATHPQAQVRDGAEAVRYAESLCAMGREKVPQFLAARDAAYAEAGRFPEAIRAAQETRDLALAKGQKDLAQAAETRLGLYRNQQPYREEP